MDVAALESHIGVQLLAGVSCGPGTLINLTTGAGAQLRGQLADHSDSKWAHGFALVSGSGTKVTGIAQKVRIDRFGKVANVTYCTFNPGNTVYLGENGQYTNVVNSQRVGFAVDVNIVFVDLDMQLDRTS